MFSINGVDYADVEIPADWVPTGTAQVFKNTFQYCNSLKDITFRGISCLYDGAIGDFGDADMYGLTSVSFPDVVSCQEFGLSGSWGKMFNGVRNLSSIHFGHEEVSADILSSCGFDSLWGIANTEALSVWAGEILLYSPPPPWQPEKYIYKTNSTESKIPLFTYTGNSDYPFL